VSIDPTPKRGNRPLPGAALPPEQGGSVQRELKVRVPRLSLVAVKDTEVVGDLFADLQTQRFSHPPSRSTTQNVQHRLAGLLPSGQRSRHLCTEARRVLLCLLDDWHVRGFVVPLPRKELFTFYYAGIKEEASCQTETIARSRAQAGTAHP